MKPNDCFVTLQGPGEAWELEALAMSERWSLGDAKNKRSGQRSL